MYLIFASNEKNAREEYAYNDITGQQYHYPNTYKNKIKQGTHFIYYSGTKKKDGSTGDAEYFGYGIVGEITEDPNNDGKPKNKWYWYCDIDNYYPFPINVPIKINGEYLEDKKGNKHFTNGVRVISEEVFKKILKHSNSSPDVEKKVGKNILLENIPNEMEFKKIFKSRSSNSTTKKTSSSQNPSSSRYSKRAKIIGDRCEEIVLKHLEKKLSGKIKSQLRWVADEKEKPGWDIEYKDEKNNLICVEVKGTGGDNFYNFELTERERLAALKHKENYKVYLVSKCFEKKPCIEILPDFNKFVESKEVLLQPIRYRVTKDQK